MTERRIGRFCSIDIGTVTCRMLIADALVREDGSIDLVELDKEYEIINLGEGVDSTHMISADALSRAKAALSRFMKVRKSFDTDFAPIIKTMAIATSAARDAENSSDFISLAKDLGISLDVISGKEEASLSFLGASSFFAEDEVAVVDVGGGSTEISIGKGGGKIKFMRSFDVGSRRITERFLKGHPVSQSALDEARTYISQVFEEARNAVGASNPKMVAVAGTATSAISMKLKLEIYDSSMVHGAQMTRSELEGMSQELASMRLEQVESIVGLDPRRAPVILGGLIVLDGAMEALGVESFTASESDILEGMVMYNAK